MSEYEEEVRGYASWMVSTLAMLQLLKNNNAEGHSQQLNYIFQKCFKIAEKKYGDDFLLAFGEIYQENYGSRDKENEFPPVDTEVIH